MTILVTGATGYIASLLIPRLLDSGQSVRTMARHPLRLKGRNWFHDVENIPADVMAPSTLAPALHGVDTAYYLIHNMLSGHGYTERELAGARAFASAAEAAGVKHIIYLGGLADPESFIARHLRSRIETGVALRQSRVPVTEFRAGVIVGSGSISFEMIRFITELFPIIPGPAWMNNYSQPIAAQNVVDYLVAALDNPNGRGQVFEIGGPEIAQYKDLMKRYARLRGLKRNMLVLPYIPLWFMSFGVGLTTPVPRQVAHALIGGSSHHSVVKYNEVSRVFPEVNLIGYDEAVQIALARLSPKYIERIWDDGQHSVKSLKHEGCFIDHREVQVNAAPGKVFQMITNMGGSNNRLHVNWPGRLCGWANKVISPRRHKDPKLKINIKDHREFLSPGGFVIKSGDLMDYYRVESIIPDQHLLLHCELKTPGEVWLEWRVDQIGGFTHLTQTTFFAPRGLPGFLFWVLLYPFHVIILRNLIRAIARGSLV
jgi:uncharacterized protein YbjT (DUF2867 family)